MYSYGPLIAGTLVRRYKRFLADIALASGEVVTVHCANSGAMTSCATPLAPVRISLAPAGTKRKLPHTWEMIDIDGTWVGVNTALPNHVVTALVRGNQVPELMGYDEVRQEVRYGVDGGSRIDLHLVGGPQGADCHVEVKNATLRVGDDAAFPDSVTLRGQKHLRELTALARAGRRAVMFYYIGRSDVGRMRPADEVDPTYGKLLREAVAAGVEAVAYRMAVSPQGIVSLGPVPIDL